MYTETESQNLFSKIDEKLLLSSTMKENKSRIKKITSMEAQEMRE
jgi:hypothetical protein